MVQSITFGTALSTIPLKDELRLDRGYPIFIKQEPDGMTIVECPAFDEYGYGQSFEEALSDLGSSIVDLWNSLKGMIARQKNLAGELRQVLDEMNDHIVSAEGGIA